MSLQVIKRFALTLLLLLLVSFRTEAQGTFTVGNYGYLISATGWGGDSGPIPASTSGVTFRFAILYGPSSLQTFSPFVPYTASPGGYLHGNPDYSVLPQLGTNASVAGRVVFPSHIVAVPGYSPGITVSMLMVGWQDPGDLSTWSDFLNSGAPYGTSGRVDLVLGGEPTNFNFFGSSQSPLATQSVGFSIFTVPEPASISLAALITALLVSRRCI